MSLTVAKVRQRLNRIIACLENLNVNDMSKVHLRLKCLVDEIMDLSDDPARTDMIKMLEIIVEACVDENVSLLISRQVLTHFYSKVLSELNDSQSKSLALFALDKMGSRTVSFENQITKIRFHLSTIYEKEKNWKDAVLMLVSNPIETGQRLYSVDFKLELFIRIARLYLKDKNPLQAESYINRASILQTKDKSLMKSFQFTHARVLDHRHRFNEAARKYNELSLRSKISDCECLEALNSAIVCTILSPVGNQRFQMLTTLYKDERCQILMRFSTLEKLYLYRMIDEDEYDEIESMLSSHQKAKTKNNTSLLFEAMIEHNMLSISKIYKNIKIKSLASLLKVDPYKAETTAAKMISEERMKGSIDQIDGFIHFKSQNEPISLPTWDNKIESLCCHVNRIIEMMNADSSIREWMNEHLDNQMSL